MLIDNILSEYQFSEFHSIRIRASAESVYRSLHAFDSSQLYIGRLLMFIRSFGNAKPKVIAKGFTGIGFIPLADTSHEIVLGLVGQFWKPRGNISKIDPEDFNTFNTPGYAKAVWNFRIQAITERSVVLSTETRVRCLDKSSRMKFAFYWLFVRPFSGLIRIEILRKIKKQVEAISHEYNQINAEKS
ncbi:hypothetical protein K1X84_10320 [bacterium]|nr:hypothetical protein [bacterium]